MTAERQAQRGRTAPGMVRVPCGVPTTEPTYADPRRILPASGADVCARTSVPIVLPIAVASVAFAIVSNSCR